MRTSTAKHLLSLGFAVSLCTAAISQTPTSYLNDAGSPPYATTIPVENGYIDLSNGNLHLEFPLASPPQRGALQVNERLVYDSRIWMFSPFGTHGSYHWWPYNIYGTTTQSGGWRLVTGAEVGSVSNSLANWWTSGCSQPYYGAPWEEEGDAWYTLSFSWTDPSGTIHPFSATETYEETDCWTPGSPTYNGGSSTDGSGYSMSFDVYGNPIIMDASGNEVYPRVTDRYGNYATFDSNGNVIDDTGSTPVIATTSGNTTYYDVLAPNGTINNNGTRVRYTVTTSPVSVNTQFDQSDIYEWTSSNDLTPVQSIQLPDGSAYHFTYDSTGELQSMTLPTGGEVFYTYAYFNDSSNTANRWVYSRAHGADPVEYFTPNVVSTCSGYSNGCQETVTHHKPSGDETVYLLTVENGAWTTQTTVHWGSASIGPQLMKISSSNTYSNPCTYPCSGGNYLTSSLATTEVDGGSAPIYAQTQTFFNTFTGTPTVVKDWDYASSVNYGGPTGAPVRETDYTYTGSPSNLTAVTVLDGSGNQVGQTTYGYTTSAAAPSGSIPQQDTTEFQYVYGIEGSYLNTVTHWLNTGSSPVTTITMDNTGQVTSVQDPDPTHNPTQYTYQCSNSLVTTVTDPLSHVTTYTPTECNSRAILRIQDSNDVANSRPGTQYAYESQAGRLQSITYPDGGSTTYSYPLVSASPTPLALEVDTTVAMTSATSITTASILDSYGRSYQTNANGVTSETTYDANGRVYSVTNPHTSLTSSTDGTTYITSYDPFDRPVTQQNPDGSTRGWWYYGNTTDFSDEAGSAIWRTSDAFGHLKTVIENPVNGPLVTYYSYDTLGDLTSVNQVGNGTTDVPRGRTFTYDSLARLVCAANPESTSASSPSCPAGATSSIPTGTISYTYDPNGNVSTRTDGRAITTSYTYDALNRMTSETASGINNRWYYDSVSWATSYNSIGRLVSVTNYGVSDKVFSYDAMGRVNWQATGTPSSRNNTGIIMTAQYDLAGDMTDLIYPDGNHIQQAFDSSGRLCNITAATGSPITCSTNATYSYFSQPSYTPIGALSSATLGSGMTQNYSYNNRLQVGEIWAANSGGTRYMDKLYCYGASSCTSAPTGNNGNIVAIADALNSNRNQTFTYDALNRLNMFSNGSSSMSQSFSIDSFGNASASGTFSSPSCCNAKNQVPSFAYDNAGNVTQAPAPGGGTLYYNYDSIGQLSSIGPSGSPTATYTYDGDGARVRKDDASGWKEFVYFGGAPMAEKNSAGSWSDYIVANGQRIARVDPTTNLVQNSQAFGASSWSGYCGPTSNMTVNTTDLTAPDGTNTATKFVGPSTIVCDGSQPSLGILTTIPSGVQAGQTYTTSIWLRGATGGETVNLGLNDCAMSNVILTTGWQRYAATWTANSSITTCEGGYGVRGLQINDFTPNNTYYVWGAQTELAASAGPYVATGSSTETLHYYSADHLGTTTLVTDAAGGLQNDSDYYPYGAENPIDAGVENHYKFTGYERDADSGETDNDYAMARYYASGALRFMSPDPFDGSMDASNPQSFNRYAYVGNMPLGYTDPNGLEGGAAGPCTVAIVQGGVNPIADGICGVVLAASAILTADIIGLFEHPKLKGTVNPRPKVLGSPDYGVPYPGLNRSIAGALGLPDTACDFGVCDDGGIGGMGFQTAGTAAAAAPVAIPTLAELIAACAAAEPCGAIALGAAAVGGTGVAVYEGSQVYKGRTNVGDTGIEDEARHLIAQAAAGAMTLTMCQALQQLQRGTNDPARLKRIKATQKKWGCRRSTAGR